MTLIWPLNMFSYISIKEEETAISSLALRLYNKTLVTPFNVYFFIQNGKAKIAKETNGLLSDITYIS